MSSVMELWIFTGASQFSYKVRGELEMEEGQNGIFINNCVYVEYFKNEAFDTKKKESCRHQIPSWNDDGKKKSKFPRQRRYG